MSIRLSPRLRMAAELVPPGARVIDVGTDHAMVPVWLVQEGRVDHVWASDLRPGPLQGAERLIQETATGSRIDLRLADGLKGFGPEDGDAIIIAGMGGETIVSILSEAPWITEECILILAPQTKQHLLRRFLIGSGFSIQRELLVRDAGRIYPILTARCGAASSYAEAELWTGLFSQISSDPLFPAYLEQLSSRAADAAPYDPEAAERLREFESMKERLNECRP